MVQLLLRKLKNICRYCAEASTSKAMSGMRDINEILMVTVQTMMNCKTKFPTTPIDIVGLLGTLQLALDAMQAGDLEKLGSALSEGLMPELERAIRDEKVAAFCEAAAETLLENAKTSAESRVSGENAVTAPDAVSSTSSAVHGLVNGVADVTTNDVSGGMSETKADFGNIIEQLENRTLPAVVCMFGYGDGTYYEQLSKSAPDNSTFIVYEPETDSIVELRTQLQQHVDFYRLEAMVVCATPGYETIFATEYAEFLHAVNENRERILVNKNTLRRFKDTASRNVITNLGILEHFNLVSDLETILPRSTPVIIVSAGPSLDKNIEKLKAAKGHALIFAVDTALKYLMQHDIMPDLCITVEPIKPMANYEDERCFDVPQIFDCESNPEIVSRERERIFIYNCRDYVKRLLESVGVEVPGDAPSGGSVATAAFAICYELQMKTIIMIGQDLAYSGTATHAGGVESAGINGDIGYEMVDGIDGEPVRTRSDWKGYLRWFENSIRMINEQKLDMTIIDATEGGALIHGSRVMTLEDAIAKYCSGSKYDFAEELKRLPFTLNAEDYAEVKALIEESFEELKTVKDCAHKAQELCRRMLGRARREDSNNAPKAKAIGYGEDSNNAPEAKAIGQDVSDVKATLAQLRSTCESAYLYPLINNYAVSDIMDEVSKIRLEGGAGSEFRQQLVAFEAIETACGYFESLKAE